MSKALRGLNLVNSRGFAFCRRPGDASTHLYLSLELDISNALGA